MSHEVSVSTALQGVASVLFALKKRLHFCVIPFAFLAIMITQQCLSSHVGKLNIFFA